VESPSVAGSGGYPLFSPIRGIALDINKSPSDTPPHQGNIALGIRLRIRLRRIALVARSIPLARRRVIRLPWFRLKRALHISTGSDRMYLVEEFVHRLKAGSIGNQCHVTTERGDGAGAQAQAKMSALCLARAHGLTYVHEPFRSIEHAEGPPDEWAASWERMFNLGHGEASAANSKLPRVGIEDFMADRRWWSSPCLLSAPNFTGFTDREPDAYLNVAKQLRTKYALGAAARPRSRVLEVCVHLRRGDVSADDPETAGRLTRSDAMANSIAQVRATLEALGVLSRVRVFSQGNERDFAAFRDMGCELCVDLSALATFRELVAADILIMSKSSFSYVAAILNDGVKVYDRYARSPMSEWIERDRNGHADPVRLRSKIEARAKMNRGDGPGSNGALALGALTLRRRRPRLDKLDLPLP
jgi:hypothetical protein